MKRPGVVVCPTAAPRRVHRPTSPPIRFPPHSRRKAVASETSGMTIANAMMGAMSHEDHTDDVADDAVTHVVAADAANAIWHRPLMQVIAGTLSGDTAQT